MTLLLLFHGGGPASVPTVTTDSIAEVASTTARAQGTVSSDGGAAISERGFVVSTSTNPTISDTKYIVTGTTGAMEKLLSSLTPNLTYYIRAYATNAVGTGYGANISFKMFKGFVDKHYLYRVFDNNTYVTTWTKEVLSEPSFRSTINGGVGELVIELGRDFDDFGEDDDVKLNNKVECWVVDNEAPNGRLLYSGYISGYQPSVKEVEEKVQIIVLGYVTELQRMILRDASGNTQLTYNSYDPSDILTDVIDKYRAVGGHINYAAGSIQKTNTTVSYTFNTNTVKEVLDKIIELCPVGWYFRIDPDNTIYLAPKNILSDHIFTLGLNVENLETFRRVEDLVNRVLFIGGGSPALYRMYENTSSQDTYGLYEKKIVDQRVTVVATASTIANREIDSKKDPEIRSMMTIVDSSGPGSRGYDIETIKPGQTLKIKNLEDGVSSTPLWDVAIWDTDVWDQTLATSAADVIQILSVSYTPDSIQIEASSRLPQIAKRIEDVQRNLEVTQMMDNPAAPS
jgi:hypothetical protein